MTLECIYCGNTYKRNKSASINSKYCSRKCKDLHRREWMRGKNHYNWKGGNVSQICQYCNKEFYVAQWLARRGTKFCSKTCKDKHHSWLMSGERSPFWQGGKSFEPYSLEWTEDLKEKVRNRDGRKCVVCGVPENGVKHDVHHIDGDKHNCNKDNLITYCHQCHTRHHHRKAA